MNRYELLTKHKNIIFTFIKNGILSYQINRDMEIYELFLTLEDTQFNEEKYIILGEQFELTPKRIQQILFNMNKNIN